MKASNTPPSSANVCNDRYEAIDGLRAYAAIGIVLMHVLSNIAVKPADNYFTCVIIPWFTDFTLMFMVVSGFSLCCGYYERIKTGKITPNSFYRKRYLRILPFFACLCILDLAITPNIEQVYMLYANMTLCFNLIPNANITMIGVGWFLGLVFVFYLLFPFFVFMLDNKKRGWMSLTLALILAGLCTIYSFNSDIATAKIGRANIIYTMPLFMAGGMIYLYRDKLKFNGLKQYLFLVFCLILTVAFFMYLEMHKTAFGTLLTEMLLFGVWLIYALGSRDLILNNRVVKFLSGISMEVYLCHMVIYRVVERLHIESYIGNENFLYVFTCILVIAGAIIFSWLMKKHILPYLLGKVNIKV